jgi:pectate lyase
VNTPVASGAIGRAAHRLIVHLASLGILLGATAAEPQTRWAGGDGVWTDARWTDGAPDAFKEVVVGQTSQVTLPRGTCLAADLEVGRQPGDHARVEVTGGKLVLLQDSLFVGERSGSSADFVLHAGAVHSVMDVFVGGATAAPGRATKASLTIDGGSFVGRTLTIGLGYGATSRVNVIGSKPEAVHALDNVYLQASAAPDGTPGDSTLAFALDEHGVTPITIESRRDGLRVIKDARSHCRLEIRLVAIPPREDVTLIAAHKRPQGTFDNLPEGAAITADFGGRTYRWSLTYHGGASQCDVVLRNRSEYGADAPVTHVRPLPAVPVPLWTEHPLLATPLRPGTPAFEGAEGFGAYTRGGSGGRTIYVNTLADSGPGSLREAIAAQGPRTIAFRIGGTIRLQSPLEITEPFLTLDAQGAPSPGITLRSHGIEVRTHDIVLRYFRVRVGDDAVRLDDPNRNYATADGDYALYFIEGSDNCIADHLSLSWSTNKTLSTTKMSDRITIQWCILSEALNFAHHSYASIAGGNRVTWHHNLFAHNQSRSVRFQGAVQADFRNNVVYDWGDTAAYGEFARLNYVGNYLKAGPSTTQRPRLFHLGDKVVAPHTLFVADNVIDGEPAVARDNWRGMGYYFERDTVAAREPFVAPAVQTDSASVAFERVLAGAGASRPVRDRTDARVVTEVRSGTGRIIEHVADVGGWPEDDVR